MYENEDYFIPIIWEGDGSHPSPNYAVRNGDYNVMALPSTALNGDTFDLGGGAGVLGRYQAIYNNLVNISSPMELEVLMNLTGGQIEITADALMTETIAVDDYRIIFMLTYFYNDSYNSTVIDYYEEDFGLTASGSSEQFVHSFDVNPDLDLANTRAVVLVQHVNTTGVFTVGGYPQYPFNMYPILQSGMANYPLVAPNPIANLEMDLNDTVTFDLTDYFYYQGNPVAADLSVESSDPTIVEATLDGTDLTLTSFDNGGNVQIDILGSYNGYDAISSFNVYVVDPSDSYIVILDLDPTATGSTLKTSIENFYTAGEVNLTSDINAFPLTSSADAVFVLLGIYSSNYVLSATEAGPLASYLDGGGNVYMEGGDTWYYDTPTSVHPYFNINGVSDGSSDLSNVNGHDFLDGMSWSYTGENSWIDHLAPIAPAVTIFSNPAPSYDCGVAYDSGTYKTVGTSFEITGLGGTNSLDDAVSGIMDFFGIAGEPLPTPTNLAIDEAMGLFTWDAPVSEDLIGYDVYLDDELVGSPTDTQWQFVDLVNGQTYTAGVSAVYDEGVSNIEEISFTYSGTEVGNVVVAATVLNNNYPNPFNPETNIAYSIKEAGNVTIEVYNLRGQLVKTLVNETKETGDYTTTWSGMDNSNKSVSSGVYFYKMKSGNYTSTKKMILMK